MTIFWTVTEWLAALVENWVIFDFCRRFHSPKYPPFKDNLIFAAFILLDTILSMGISVFTAFSGMLTLVCMGVAILYGVLFLKGAVFSKLFLPIVSFGLIFIINIFVNIICSSIFSLTTSSLFTEQDGYRFFCIIVTKLLFFLATRMILVMFKKGINLKQREWLLISGILFISLCMGIAVIEIGLEQNAALTPPYFLCFFGIVCINIFMFIMLMQISAQNEKSRQMSLLELQVSQQKQALEQMDILQSKIRQSNHDHLNHLFCLQEMLKENQNAADASDYLQKLIQKNPEISTAHILIPDQFLRAVLTVKMELCRKKNIDISLKTDDTKPSCDSVDLCILLSNLLDNAIEASEKVHEPKVEVILTKQKSYYTVLVKNRIEKSVLKKNAELKTTKADSECHGIGVQSIREIVSRCGGMMEYYEEGGWFIASVWLPQEE